MYGDGVVLSNHGGRQIEDCSAPIDALRDFSCPQDRAVLVESGYRSGVGIARALALGADAVMIGRAMLYGLAAAGEEGAAGDRPPEGRTGQHPRFDRLPERRRPRPQLHRLKGRSRRHPGPPRSRPPAALHNILLHAAY